MFGWLLSTPPDPILLKVGGFSVRWYGIILAIALVAGILLAQHLSKKVKLSAQVITDLAIVVTICAVIGARLVHVIDEWAYYQNHVSEIPQLWRGGLAFHGVLLGGILALWIYSRRKKIASLLLLDLCFPALALGQVIGRWGNWINQELYGRPTTLPWAIPIDPVNRVTGYETAAYFHPLFLYESIGNIIILVLLLWLWRWRGRRLGDISAMYLILSPVLRFSLDFLRVNQPMVGPLTNAQLFSIPLIVAGIILLITRKRRIIN